MIDLLNGPGFLGTNATFHTDATLVLIWVTAVSRPFMLLSGWLAPVLGVFIVLRANKLVPKALQFSNYKLFMRTSFVLYMLATLLGVIVYVVVYVYGI